MTANAYVPDKARTKRCRRPARAWSLAIGETGTGRAVALHRARAKHGFFVLVVDAFGAGERGVGKNLGEYHGEMTGRDAVSHRSDAGGLAGLREHARGRLSADSARSGRQTDRHHRRERRRQSNDVRRRLRRTIQGVVPVCSVGNYQAYLGAACCMCEVVPGACGSPKRGTSSASPPAAESDDQQCHGGCTPVLGRRGKKSFARAAEIFAKLSIDRTPCGHTIIESGHDYNQPMREAMYGWVKTTPGGRRRRLARWPNPKSRPKNPNRCAAIPAIRGRTTM